MELRWLNDFIALAHTRHFSRAADQQNVTQPTFSRRIKLLEEEMGALLINRNTLPLSLTPAGEVFLHSAERITALLADTREQCQRIQADDTERLNFATTQSLYINLYQSWLKPLSDRLDLTIDYDLNSSKWGAREFADALLSGTTDLMLTYWHPEMALFSPEQSQLLQHITVNHEQLLLCSAANGAGEAVHTFVPGTAVRRSLPCITYDSDALLGPVVQATMESIDLGVSLEVVCSEKHCIGVKALVKGGFGVGWLPGRLAHSALQHGQLALIDQLQSRIPLEVRLYRLRNNSHSQLTYLWESLERQGAQLLTEHLDQAATTAGG
ncbi:LysR family transcriptional regulator [Allohahella marinimesophila]|uniref:LysR substrate-binding domain-containing protein n=1 Tax=Allohahella marinimesophila TaxID=1054972 RepID=A0ABP7PR81_9GAMM